MEDTKGKDRNDREEEAKEIAKGLKEGLKKYAVAYRGGEILFTVKAKNREKAKEKVLKERKWTSVEIGRLWPSFIEVDRV